MKIWAGVLSLLLAVMGGTASADRLKKPISEYPVSETCGREFARWEYLFISGKAHDRLQEKDWVGSIEEMSKFNGVALTCWEQIDLLNDYAQALAGMGDSENAVATLRRIVELEGASEHQIEGAQEFIQSIEQGEWVPYSDRERDEFNRDAKPIRAPLQSPFKDLASRFKGKIMCYVLIDVTPEGEPANMVARCSTPDFERPAEKAVRHARFEPKLEDGQPVMRYNVLYPFEINLNNR